MQTYKEEEKQARKIKCKVYNLRRKKRTKKFNGGAKAYATRDVEIAKLNGIKGVAILRARAYSDNPKICERKKILLEFPQSKSH